MRTSIRVLADKRVRWVPLTRWNKTKDCRGFHEISEEMKLSSKGW